MQKSSIFLPFALNNLKYLSSYEAKKGSFKTKKYRFTVAQDNKTVFKKLFFLFFYAFALRPSAKIHFLSNRLNSLQDSKASRRKYSEPPALFYDDFYNFSFFENLTSRNGGFKFFLLFIIYNI